MKVKLVRHSEMCGVGVKLMKLLTEESIVVHSQPRRYAFISASTEWLRNRGGFETPEDVLEAIRKLRRVGLLACAENKGVWKMKYLLGFATATDIEVALKKTRT